MWADVLKKTKLVNQPARRWCFSATLWPFLYLHGLLSTQDAHPVFVQTKPDPFVAHSVLLFKDGDSYLPLSDVFCQPPEEVEQGYVVAVQKTEYEAGFEIHYLCKKNFLLDGPQKVTCLPNGSWSEPPPFCRGRESSPWTVI